jgi:type I restriction enzyme S subunit
MADQTTGKVPRIRFKAHTEPWVDEKIGDVLAEKRRPIVLEDDQRYELITVKRRNEGVVSRGHLLGRDILVKNYAHLKAGDFVISKRQVVHGATGIVPPALDGAIVSNEYLTAVDGERLLTEFLTIVASLPAMRKKFFLSSYGVDIEKLFFDADDWKKRSVMLPDVQEQSRIAQVFRILDKLISLHHRKHEKLLALKMAMLQRMFPQPGSSVPEVRFSGFSSPWDSIVLGKLGQPYSGIFGKTKEDFGRGDARFVTYMGVFSNAICGPDATEAIGLDKAQNEVKKGDVMFTISSETPEEVGMSSVWSGNEEGVYLNSFCFGFRPLVSLRSEYLAYVLRASAFRSRVRVLAQGISRYNISKAKVMNIAISVPNEEEQERIGAYFCTLDALIEKHATQIQKLRQIKSACLEDMFV